MMRHDGLIQVIVQPLFGNGKVVKRLQGHLTLRTRAEKPGQPQGSVGRYRAPMRCWGKPMDLTSRY